MSATLVVVRARRRSISAHHPLVPGAAPLRTLVTVAGDRAVTEEAIGR